MRLKQNKTIFIVSVMAFFFLLIGIPVHAQVGTNEIETNPEPSTTISAEESLLPPRMNTAQRNAICPIADGLIIYNTDIMCLERFDGSGWYDLCSGSTYTPPFYPVKNPATGKTWADRNLGADQVAESSTDHLSYGYLYQWGRAEDGHQEIIWSSATAGTPVNEVTATLCTMDVCPDARFVYTMNTLPRDWRSPQNNDLWQGTSGTNNPCPAGYRLPTHTELDNEYLSWSSKNPDGAFASPLKFSVPGWRSYFDGTTGFTGETGFYWTSTVSGISSWYLEFGASNATLNASFRAFGFSVRCIQD
jgi:uncharacterized protein (TIGR02145 family)